MMPLLKVTDMTYDRSLLGRVVGYGKFMLESAGQDQALSTIDHVPDADTHYRAICTQLFGPGSMLRFAPGGSPPQPPPRDDGPGGGGGGATERAGCRGPAPRARAASLVPPTGAHAEPDHAHPSRGTAARTWAGRCTWATPARSPSCECRARGRGRPAVPTAALVGTGLSAPEPARSSATRARVSSTSVGTTEVELATEEAGTRERHADQVDRAVDPRGR